MFLMFAYDALAAHGVDYKKIDGMDNLLDARLYGVIDEQTYFRLAGEMLVEALRKKGVSQVSPTVAYGGTA